VCCLISFISFSLHRHKYYLFSSFDNFDREEQHNFTTKRPKPKRKTHPTTSKIIPVNISKSLPHFIIFCRHSFGLLPFQAMKKQRKAKVKVKRAKFLSNFLLDTFLTKVKTRMITPLRLKKINRKKKHFWFVCFCFFLHEISFFSH